MSNRACLKCYSRKYCLRNIEWRTQISTMHNRREACCTFCNPNIFYVLNLNSSDIKVAQRIWTCKFGMLSVPIGIPEHTFLWSNKFNLIFTIFEFSRYKSRPEYLGMYIWHVSPTDGRSNRCF